MFLPTILADINSSGLIKFNRTRATYFLCQALASAWPDVQASKITRTRPVTCLLSFSKHMLYACLYLFDTEFISKNIRWLIN